MAAAEDLRDELARLAQQAGGNTAVLQEMIAALAKYGAVEFEVTEKTAGLTGKLKEMGESVLITTAVVGGLTGALVGLVGMLDPGRARIFHQELRDLGASLGTILVPVLDVARVALGWLNEFFTNLSPTVKALTAAVVVFGLASKIAWESVLGPLGPLIPILAAIATYFMGAGDQATAMGTALAPIGQILGTIGDTLGVVLDTVGQIVDAVMKMGLGEMLKGLLITVELIIKTAAFGIITIMILLDRLFGLLTGKKFEKSLGEELEDAAKKTFLGEKKGEDKKTTAAPTQATVQGVEAMSMQLQQAGILGGAGGPTKSEQHLESIDGAVQVIKRIAEAWKKAESVTSAFMEFIKDPFGAGMPRPR
jgi:hypothetical protein